MQPRWTPLFTAALAACAPAAMGTDSDGGALDAAVCSYSPGPYGNAVGDTLFNYEFAQCNGEGYALGAPDHCQYRATLLIAAAGW